MKFHNTCWSVASIFLTLTFIFSGQSLAGNIDAKLPDSDNTSSFQVKNSQDNVLLSVKSGGNVGIGTTTPEDGKMQVVGGSSNAIDASSSGANGIHATSGAGGGYAAGHFSASNAGTYGVWASSSNYDAIYAYSAASAPSAAIRAEASSGAYAAIFNGNVGIGTSSPQGILDVDGHIRLRPGNLSNAGIWLTTISNVNEWYMGKTNIGGTNQIGFYKSGWRMVVEAGGNVGIGTTAPAYTLDVEGNVQAKAYYTGDIFFQKNGNYLWRMFEDEKGLYLENLKTGKVSKIFLEDDITALKKDIKDELRKEIMAELEKKGG